MPIYWSCLFLPIVIKAFQNIVEGNVKFFANKEKNDNVLVIVSISFIIFFAGMRSFVADTNQYIMTFNKLLPSTIEGVFSFDWEVIDRDWFFYALSALIFKALLPYGYQLWLFVIAVISGIPIIKALIKHSECKWLSCYIFVAGSLFTYFFNGMRQFIAMSILFWCTELIIEKKYKTFLLILAFLAQIHGSAWFFIPVVFLYNFKPWSKWIMLIILGCCLIGIGFNSFAGTMDNMLENTQYAGMGQTMVEGNGSSIIRLFVAMVPVIISLIFRRRIELENNKYLDLCINCSVMNMSCMFISTFSFGIFMGRVAAYYDMFNIMLVPYLLTKCFEKRLTPLIIIIAMAVYFAYYYYQMMIAWGGWPYISKVLGLSFW